MNSVDEGMKRAVAGSHGKVEGKSVRVNRSSDPPTLFFGIIATIQSTTREPSGPSRPLLK